LLRKRQGVGPAVFPVHRNERNPGGYNGLNMIAHLRGTLLSRHPNQVVVETAGVGYEINISVPTFSELPQNGAAVALHIYTHVREDLIALYGFLRPAEKQLFEKLITVSGIGPKLAITILSGMAANEMADAIRGNDLARLTKIPGIGKKDRGAHGAGTARQIARTLGRFRSRMPAMAPWKKMFCPRS
jgi:Holliday junction resolvasome RuvABC DNA-binding subunit